MIVIKNKNILYLQKLIGKNYNSSMKNNIKKTADDLVRLSLVNNLKIKIEELKSEVNHQKLIIEGYKKSTKTTLIN